MAAVRIFGVSEEPDLFGVCTRVYPKFSGLSR